MSFRWLLPLVAWLMPVVASADHDLTLGVFAYRPVEVIEARYQPLADYLGEAIPHASVELRVLTLDEIDQAIAHRQLDLLMTNPAHFMGLRSRNSLTGALATLISREQGEAVTALGGVILARAEEGAPTSLQEVAGLRIGIPGKRFLGGYQVHAYELHQAGVPLDDQDDLVELGSHDAVVSALLEERVDVGFVRTGIIERMQTEGRLDPSRLKVIHPQHFAGFPFAVSTRLYPEWPFIALPHVPAETMRQVAVALFSLSPDQPAAQAALLAGFAPPQDYLPVENLARTLRLPPFEQVPAFTWRDVVHRFRPALLVAVGSALIVALLLLLLARGNRQLKAQHRRLRLAASVFTHSHEGIMITSPGGTVVDVNRAFERITGYPSEEVLGHSALMLAAQDHGNDFLLKMRQVLMEQGHWEGEMEGRCRDGTIKPLRLTLSPVLDPHGQVQRYVGLLVDITQLKRHQRELQQAAQHDALTGLPNRLLLSDRLRQAQAQVDRRGTWLGLVFIDLDGFKAVNDSLGHDVGDQLLVALSARMGGVLRAYDTLARLGGDEFVAVLVDLVTPEEGELVAKRLLESIDAPLELAGERVQVSASLGLACYRPGSGSEEVDADQLLRQADQAMYEAKRRGKNRLHRVTL
ncbi:diguanylate cyclase [Halomonas sp. G15]|uniref:diguanylate cyclase domain-containing protein n=1 Tax=Halomonas sp. G15 TaxID=2903521 RepID=UPI001E34FD17|nr:diguanylate cyclase [Halomonas sp. G15]